MYRAGRPATNTATMKRIQREIRDLEKEDMGEITLKPSDSNVFNWTATIPGPEGSIYEGGLFKLQIQLPPDYPFSSPRVTFDTRIYHMNINSNGAICIDVLKTQWSPALSLFKVMLSLSSLLTDPNPNDPLVPTIAQEYLRNRTAHDNTAREWTRLYAKPPPKPPAPVSNNNNKGKEKAVPAPAASSNPSSARATPTTTAPMTRRSTRAAPEVIDVSSDVEETGPNEPIEIEDEEDAVPTPKPSRKGKGKAPAAASRSTESAGSSSSSRAKPVAGAKRRQAGDAEDESEPGTRSGSGRATRSSKRRAGEGPTGDTIVID